MLMPKKVKFRKQQKGKMRGKAWRGSTLSFGEYGLKVMECGYITDRQIEASRIAMTRFIKRGGKVWLRSVPGQASHQEAGRSPNGLGQGRAGSLGGGCSSGQDPLRDGGRYGRVAQEAMRLAANKLPLKTRFVQRPAVIKNAPEETEASAVVLRLRWA
jgi:large subunit ribosomal protein L16